MLMLSVVSTSLLYTCREATEKADHDVVKVAIAIAICIYYCSLEFYHWSTVCTHVWNGASQFDFPVIVANLFWSSCGSAS